MRHVLFALSLALLSFSARGQADTLQSGFGGVAVISGLVQLDSLTWEATVLSANWKGAWNPLANSEYPFLGISVSDNFFVNCTAFRVNAVADPVPGVVKVLTIQRPAGIGNNPSVALTAAIFDRTPLQRLPRINRAVTEPGEIGLSREDYECIMNDFVAKVEQNSVDAVRRDSTYELAAAFDTSGLSPIQGDRFVLSDRSLLGMYDSGAWVLIPTGAGGALPDTARFVVYAPGNNLADSIALYGYVPVKLDFTKANSSSLDSIHFAYAVGTPHADSLELKLSGPINFSHSLDIGALYYLQEDGTEAATPAAIRAPTAWILDATAIVLSEVGADQDQVISRQAVPSPVFTFWGGDPQNPSDSIMQVVVDSVFAPAGLAKPSTIFFMSYSSQSRNPTYQDDSPTDSPLNPSHSWFYDGNVVTRMNHLLTSVDLQATSAGLFTLDTVMLVDGIPTDSTVADWLDTNYVQNNLRLPNGAILYWKGGGTYQSPRYKWMVVDDITNTGEANGYKRILKNLSSDPVDTLVVATRSYVDSLFSLADSLRQAGDKAAPILIPVYDRNTQLNNCATSATVYTGFIIIDDTAIDEAEITFEVNASPATVTYDVYNQDSTAYYFEEAAPRSAGIYFWEIFYEDADGNSVGDTNSFDVIAGRPDTVTVWLNDTVSVTRVCGVEVSRDTIAAGGGGVSDGDKGDVVVSGSGSLWEVDAGSIEWGNLAATLQDIITSTSHASGEESGVPDGLGDMTVTHSLGATPGSIHITPKGDGFYHIQYRSANATEFIARVFDSAGVAVTSGTITFSWRAEQ